MQDIFRLALAVCVIIFHYKHFALQGALATLPSDYYPPFENYLSLIYTHGYHAVSVFFFLSGYMVTKTNNNFFFSKRIFLAKRLARIYPAHLVSLLVMGLISGFVTTQSLPTFITYNDDITNFLASLMLVNGIGIMRDVSFNLPSWSLSVELVCYLSFALIFGFRPRLHSTLSLTGLLLGALLVELADDPNVDNLGTGMVFFFSGVLAALKSGSLKGFRTSRIQYISISIIGCIISFWWSLNVTLGMQKVIWAVVCLPLMAITIDNLDQLIGKASKDRPMKWAGLISFSIYVWHFPVQAIFYYFAVLYGSTQSDWYNSSLLFWGYIMTTFAVAQFSLSFIEKRGSRIIFEAASRK